VCGDAHGSQAKKYFKLDDPALDGTPFFLSPAKVTMSNLAQGMNWKMQSTSDPTKAHFDIAFETRVVSMNTLGNGPLKSCDYPATVKAASQLKPSIASMPNIVVRFPILVQRNKQILEGTEVQIPTQRCSQCSKSQITIEGSQ